MSREGYSGSMESRRRVWYYVHRRHLQIERREESALQESPTNLTIEYTTKEQREHGMEG